jgi:hypothetical protein
MLGIFIEYKRPITYQNFLENTKRIIKIINISYLVNDEEKACNIQSVTKIPNGSNLIIGHLYGHPSITDQSPLGRIKDLIYQNKDNLESVIFTGDIYKNPSYKKWIDLELFLDGIDINFFIAPGNHDVGIHKGVSRDLFQLVFNFEYPIFLKTKNEIFLFEDTTINEWGLSDTSFKLIKENASKDISLYIFTHNIIFEELSAFSNSSLGKPNKLPLAKNLFNNFEDIYKNVSIISGDTGAFNFLPPKICFGFNNFFAVANGFGMRAENEVLILKDKKIFSYVFK